MQTTQELDARESEGNRLYWHSDLGVNQIAEEMGISKGALYGLIQPLSADLPCPRCGEGLAFTNRTARDKGFLTCASCGLEEELEVLESRGELPKRARKLLRRRGEGGGAEGEEGGWIEALGEDRTRILVGSGLVALATGIFLTRWLRRG